MHIFLSIYCRYIGIYAGSFLALSPSLTARPRAFSLPLLSKGRPRLITTKGLSTATPRQGLSSGLHGSHAQPPDLRGRQRANMNGFHEALCESTVVWTKCHASHTPTKSLNSCASHLLRSRLSALCCKMTSASLPLFENRRSGVTSMSLVNPSAA